MLIYRIINFITDHNSSCRVRANEFTFTFSPEELQDADLVGLADGQFDLLAGHRSVMAKIISIDTDLKRMTLELDGESLKSASATGLTRCLNKWDSGYRPTGPKEIKAPMPGLVLEIAVTDGQAVNEGDRILILEAMKMENSILIHADATLKEWP